jgi:hypothetical protein
LAIINLMPHLRVSGNDPRANQMAAQTIAEIVPKIQAELEFVRSQALEDAKKQEQEYLKEVRKNATEEQKQQAKANGGKALLSESQKRKNRGDVM